MDRANCRDGSRCAHRIRFNHATLNVDLWSIAHDPTEDPNTLLPGNIGSYQGPEWLHFQFRYGNNGPDTLPAGALIAIDLPFGTIWDSTKTTISSDPTGKNPVFVSTQAEPYNGPNPDAKFAYQRWTYRIDQPLPPGCGVQHFV